MTDDNEHQAVPQHTRASVALTVIGTALWVATVALVVARGWAA
ncbi:hypothetical protein [Streptomyces sp. NPDC056491]